MLIAALVISTIAAGAFLWMFWFAGRRKWNLCGDRSPELITRLEQPYPRWTVAEFLLMFGVMLVVGSLLMGLSSANVNPDTDTIQPGGAAASVADVKPSENPQLATASLLKQLKIHLAANLTALLVTLVFVRIVHGATLTHLSLIPKASDLRRGLVATVWIFAPVLLLNILVASLIKYEHPVTNLMAMENGGRTFAFLLFSAAFVTPIVEEFQFRLLLQGGLQKIADYSSVRGAEDSWRPTAVWPILVTSLLFALLHMGQGGAPIALFFLSIGLGFLYQRTGRLVTVIVVHMVLNGATLCMEFCRINAGL